MSKSDQKSITFLLADDHSLIRQGLIFLFEEMDLDCNIFHASNLNQILEKVKSHPIDIAIIDAHFPDGNSVTILPEVIGLRPDIKILIFSGIDESSHALKFLNAGANGFLSKLSDEDIVKGAIDKMIKDGEYISQETQTLLVNSFRNRKIINPLFSLTDRELQIAEMYAEGLGNLEIANKLDVKQNTVSTIKKRIFDKLDIENIVELIELVKSNY